MYVTLNNISSSSPTASRGHAGEPSEDLHIEEHLRAASHDTTQAAVSLSGWFPSSGIHTVEPGITDVQGSIDFVHYVWFS